MIAQSPPINAEALRWPTIWGLNPLQLHDRFWASRGVQVVRTGEPSEIVDGAELYLLCDSSLLTIFGLVDAVDILRWTKPDVLFVRVRDSRERGYREQVITGPGGGFSRFQRVYSQSDWQLARVALTPERCLAHLWQEAADSQAGWRAIRQEVPPDGRAAMSVRGSIYDPHSDTEVAQYVRTLMQKWKHPRSTIHRVRQNGANIVIDEAAQVDKDAALVGPVWIGAGRRIGRESVVAGPAVLWDDPDCRPQVESIQWQEIEPPQDVQRSIRLRERTSLSRGAKRAFDIIFATVALLFTLPLYPLIMLAIWIEDGRPFFFAHRRESIGGREFGCLKFRSMRRDADRLKAELVQQNQSDGPQFHIENDPRVTRVGRFLRKTNLDEIPQFWNVLLGHMSVVGPRPSPHKENQYCPAWREARLSVRPGITGLWQVRRTRRAGQDFQEWIKYDIEYVENISWALDLRIIRQTIQLVLHEIRRA